MAGVPPSEAASNLKGWLNILGIEGIGDAWTHATDVWVIWAGGGILVICSIIVLGSYIPVTVRHLPARWARGASISSSMAMPPIPTTWISDADASATIARSSLIRMHAPSDVTLGHLLGRTLDDTSQTPGEVRAAELIRKRLRDFKAQHPNGVRGEQYGKELLEWWIDEQSYHESV